jgi:hypothetical protein
MTSRGWGLGVALAAAMSAGCATTPPVTFYTLTATAGAPVADRGPSRALAVGLGPVTFPLFLDRPQLVRREPGNRLRIDDAQRWGGTLQDDFLRVWTENLSTLLKTPSIFVFPSETRYPLDFRITADVLAFEGTADGAALLKIRWILIDQPTQEVLLVEETQYQRPLPAPGDESALSMALSAVLGDFSRDVATTLSQYPLPRPTPPEPRADL